MGAVSEDIQRQLELSGIGGVLCTSSQAGYMPIPLRYTPAKALDGLGVYLRNEDRNGPGHENFTLYRAAAVDFSAEDRRRLLKNGVRCVYIRMADHACFRAQAETSILEAVQDPTKATSEKAALLYETSIELVNELVAEPDLDAHHGRIQHVSRAITTVVLSDKRAFDHLFETSHHDYYTATHMVNVGTWMVSLAYELGYTDPEDLTRICQAGMLHDIGKLFVAPAVLNKAEKLTNDEWKRIQAHPKLGFEHLQFNDSIPTMVREVCRQHHEKIDGSGYPDRRKGEEITRVARICAVVDSFDAMTALRPFKQNSLSVSDAILELKRCAGTHFDPEVVDAWIRLVGRVDDQKLEEALHPAAEQTGQKNRRRYKRFCCSCDAKVHPLAGTPKGTWQEGPPLHVRVHNVSRHGLGLLSSEAITPGTHVRVYMQAAKPGAKNKRLHGQIVRCRSHDDGRHEIGVELFPAGCSADKPQPAATTTENLAAPPAAVQQAAPPAP